MREKRENAREYQERQSARVFGQNDSEEGKVYKEWRGSFDIDLTAIKSKFNTGRVESVKPVFSLKNS